MVDRGELTLAGARSAGERGEIGNWVHDFLLTVGKNPEMAAGLKLQKRFWLGPMKMDLTRLPRCCGPESDMEYQVDPMCFDQYVGRMVESIEQGWEPPPLIVSYNIGALSVRDGNHRHEALVRSGYACYWTIIWCNTEAEFSQAVVELPHPQS